MFNVYRGFSSRSGRLLGVHFKKAPKAPPAPVYTGAANATAAGNIDAARLSAKANRVDEYTPLGSRIFGSGVGGDQDHWRSDVTLSPLGQRQFDQEQRIDQSLGGIAENGLGYVRDTLNRPFDWRSLPASPVDAGQTGQDAIMSRLVPQFARDEAAMRTQLINRGITQGSEADRNAADEFGRRKNDAYLQAAMYGIDVDRDSRETGIQEQSLARNEPLNLINALRTGSQAQMPQFQAPGQQQATPGPDLLGATNARYGHEMAGYNARSASRGNFMDGLFGLGAAGISAFSDRRLKKNIVRVGELPSGLPVYDFDYLDGAHATGVMADEAIHLFPLAVTYDPAGYAMVDYGRIA